MAALLDHAVTVRDLAWASGVGIALAAAACAVIWYLEQLGGDR